MTRRRVVSVGFLVLSGVLYFGCLFETGFCFVLANPEPYHSGCWNALAALIFGAVQQLWFAADALDYVLTGHPVHDVSYLRHGWGNLVWWANPLLLVCWLLVGTGATRKVSVGFGLAALVTAGAFMLMQEGINFLSEMSPAEVTPIESLGRGYWLWLTSIGAAVVAAFLSERIFRLPPPFKP